MDSLKSNTLYRCTTCGYIWKPSILEKQYIPPPYPLSRLSRYSAGRYVAHCPKCTDVINGGIGELIKEE